MYILYKAPVPWISVKQALPRPKTRVLAWLDGVDYPLFGAVGVKDGKAFWGDPMSGSIYGCVTHWQFLTCPEK